MALLSIPEQRQFKDYWTRDSSNKMHVELLVKTSSVEERYSFGHSGQRQGADQTQVGVWDDGGRDGELDDGLTDPRWGEDHVPDIAESRLEPFHVTDRN